MKSEITRRTLFGLLAVAPVAVEALVDPKQELAAFTQCDPALATMLEAEMDAAYKRFSRYLAYEICEGSGFIVAPSRSASNIQPGQMVYWSGTGVE
jgi:hypothetical protein